MPVKPARHEFSEEEILDILRKNASIYKDEDGFVEYFATLASYLYGTAREREPLDDVEYAPLPGSKTPPPVFGGEAGGGLLPPTAAQRRELEINPGSGRFMAPAPFRGVSSVPPPPPPSTPEPATPLPLAPPPVPEVPTAPSRTSVAGVFQLSAANLVTPPEQMPRASADVPKFIVPQSRPLDEGPKRPSGTSRVYKVARAYKSQSATEVPCKVCGTRVPIENKQCPGCGAPMT